MTSKPQLETFSCHTGTKLIIAKRPRRYALQLRASLRTHRRASCPGPAGLICLPTDTPTGISCPGSASVLLMLLHAPSANCTTRAAYRVAPPATKGSGHYPKESFQQPDCQSKHSPSVVLPFLVEEVPDGSRQLRRCCVLMTDSLAPARAARPITPSTAREQRKNMRRKKG